MLTLKRFLTFGPCFVFFAFLFIFNYCVGLILIGAEGGGFGLLLIVSTGLSAGFSALLTFGGVLPWCRRNRFTSNPIYNRLCTTIAMLSVSTALYLYLSITILDKNPRAIQLTATGMPKAQVIKLIGQPDWKETKRLWAYRVRGGGISGILVPYYFTFDAKGLLESVHS